MSILELMGDISDLRCVEKIFQETMLPLYWEVEKPSAVAIDGKY